MAKFLNLALCFLMLLLFICLITTYMYYAQIHSGTRTYFHAPFLYLWLYSTSLFFSSRLRRRKDSFQLKIQDLALANTLEYWQLEENNFWHLRVRPKEDTLNTSTTGIGPSGRHHGSWFRHFDLNGDSWRETEPPWLVHQPGEGCRVLREQLLPVRKQTAGLRRN